MVQAAIVGLGWWGKTLVESAAGSEAIRFVAGTSDLMETNAGSNVVLVWVDERHGNGIADPKPELYFETAWF